MKHLYRKTESFLYIIIRFTKTSFLLHIRNINFFKISLFFIIFTFILDISLINSQNRFQYIYQGSGDDYGYTICKSTDGGYIIAGTTTSFGNGNEILFIKIDSIGNFVWSKSLGGSGNDDINMIRQTLDGGYIATGSSSSFGTNTDAIVIKLSSTGFLQWIQVLDCGNYDSGCDIWQTIDGGYVVSGGGANPSSDQKIFVAKINSTGSITWFKRYNYSTANGSGIRQTSDKGFIVSGGIGAPTQDVLLMKLDSNGNVQWAKSFGGSKNEISYFVNITSDGGFLLSCDTWSFHYGALDIWLIKTDKNGVIQWNKTYGELGKIFRSFCPTINSDGSIIVSARDITTGTIDKCYLLKISNNGNLIWVKSYGGNGNDVNCKVIQSNDNGFISVGYSNSFGTGNYDVYIIKTDTNGNSNTQNCNQTIPAFGTTTPIPTLGNPTLTPTIMTTISSPGVSLINRTLTTTMICQQPPKAKFSSNTKRLCQGGTVNFVDSSLYNPTNWTWTFIGGTPSFSNSQNPSNIKYNISGIFPVKLVVTNFSGIDSLTKTSFINVLPKPLSNFSINDSTQCLLGNNFIFTNSTTIFSGNFTNLWKFGDGNTLVDTNASHSYSIIGNYNVKLITTSDSGCIDSVLKKVYVYPLPNIGFTINDSTQCLTCNNVIFTNNSTITSGTFTSFWYFGDGNNASTQNTTYIYSTVDTFTVKLVVNSNMGCKDSITKKVFIYPSPNVNFSINDSTQCLSNNNFSFTNLSNLAMGSFTSNWTFGDGSTSVFKNPLHTYSAISTFKVKLIIITDKLCIDSIIKNVYVTVKSSKPILASNSPICEGDTLKIFRDSIIGSTYSWAGPNGYTSNQPDVVIPNSSILRSGLYKVIRTKNNCPSDTSKINFIINSIPDTPIVTGNLKLCEGGRIQFNTQAVPGGIFSWNGPDGFISGQQNPAIDPAYQINSGIYKVFVTVNNCKSKDSRISVLINPKPYTNLGKDTVLCKGDYVLLDAGIFDSYFWQDSSTNKNFTITEAGTYLVTVTNQFGCLFTDTIKARIECPPTIFVPNVFTPNGDKINDTFEVKGQNITEYQIIIFNRWGEEMFKSEDINMNWDGKYKSTFCTDGVYYWMITYGGHYNGVIIRKFIHGTLTILK